MCLSDRRDAFVAGSMDVAGERDVRAIHPGDRRLEFRRRSLGSLLIREDTILRA